jgi:hypothetical protein
MLLKTHGDKRGRDGKEEASKRCTPRMLLEFFNQVIAEAALEPVPDPAPVRVIRRAVDHALLQLGLLEVVRCGDNSDRLLVCFCKFSDRV